VHRVRAAVHPAGEHVGDRVVGEVVKSDAKVVKIVFGATAD
jgi:hypothetical protein